MTDTRLTKIHDNIVTLIESKVNLLMKDAADLTDTQVKTLEILNKCLSVCMTRKPTDVPGEFAAISDDELEKAFE